MSRNKRIICMALIALLALLPSCGKSKDEYGSVGDADITTEETDEGLSIFEKQISPFNEYKYDNVGFESAKFSFDIPSTWTQTIYNMSCIRYDVPYDDPHFPGAAFYVKCNFDYSATPDGINEFSGIAAEYGTPMSSYITGLPFPVGGKDAWIKSYTAADESESPSFCSDETAACVKTTKDVLLVSKVTGDTASVSGMDLVTGYFRWEDFPVMIASVVPTSESADAKAMTEYIMSSVQYAPQNITEYTVRSCGDVSFELPAEFEAISGSGNIFISPAADIKATSGISAAVFKVDEELEYLTPEYFQNSYATGVANTLLDPACSTQYAATASVYEDTESKLLDEIKSFPGTATILPTGENYTCAKLTYGTVGSWLMDNYILEKGESLYLVTVMYPLQDEAIARIIEKSLIQSLRKN